MILRAMVLRKELGEDLLDVDIDAHAECFHEILPNDDGSQTVDLPGALKIDIPGGEDQGLGKRVARLGRFTAQALAYRRQPALETLVNTISDQCVVLSGPLKNLQRDVDDELRKYDRIHISGLIGNSGRSPFSVLAHGSFIINAKGYPEPDDSGVDDGGVIRIPKDVPVTLLVSGAERPGPLSIEAGSTRRFNAFATRVMPDLEHHRGLLEAFSNGDRTCELRLEIIDIGREHPWRRIVSRSRGGGDRSRDTRWIRSNWLFRASGKESAIHNDPGTGGSDDRSAELATGIDTLGREIARLTARIKELAVAIRTG